VPTYGYRCEQCGQEFDVWQRMSDEPKAACPACGGAGKRLFFPAGIVFKGTGFYKTDSRGSTSSSTAGSSSSSSSSNGTTPKPDKPDSTTKPSTTAAAAD
jgi:putative FmdB family regulatory protein